MLLFLCIASALFVGTCLLLGHLEKAARIKEDEEQVTIDSIRKLLDELKDLKDKE
jgi:hypothetical protein